MKMLIYTSLFLLVVHASPLFPKTPKKTYPSKTPTKKEKSLHKLVQGRLAKDPREDDKKPVWKLVSERDNVNVYVNTNNFDGLLSIRATGMIDAPMGRVMSVMADEKRKHEWIPNTVEVKALKIASPFARIEYSHSHTPWPLTDREFLTYVRAQYFKKTKKLVIRLRSIEKIPNGIEVPKTDNIRGIIHYSDVWLSKAEGGKKTFVEVELLTDPKGSIPKFLVNWVQKDWPRGLLHGLARQVEKKDIKVKYRF